MILSNFHSHCTFCDGRSTPEDFVKFAVSHSLRAYGFSSHAPLPFETFWNMSAGDMPEYLAEINRLKTKYKDKLEIYLGLEIDYLDESCNPSSPYYQQLPLDYRIGSVHFLPVASPLCEENMVCIDGAFSDFKQSVETRFGGDIRKLATKFYDSSMKMVEAGGIDIVGHIDKVYMNGGRYDESLIHEPWYRKMFLSLLDLIAEKGLIVEINTKNLNRNHQTFPHLDYIPMLLERKIPVMVNADTHLPDLVDSGLHEARQLLKGIGFRTTRELVKERWEDIPMI